jgi:hypothetical protein
LFFCSRAQVFKRRLFKYHELIGFLNITHKIEKDDNGNYKLVEIPRKEYEVDDIVECEKILKNDETLGVVFGVDNDEDDDDCVKILYANGDTEYLYAKHGKPKKVGILGVNYEFANGRL